MQMDEYSEKTKLASAAIAQFLLCLGSFALGTFIMCDYPEWSDMQSSRIFYCTLITLLFCGGIATFAASVMNFYKLWTAPPREVTQTMIKIT